MPGLNCPMKCLKCAVFFSNIICFIGAAVLIAVGSYVFHKFDQYGSVLHDVWRATPIALIVLGIIILLVSFLGCCGAIKENVCMLYMYGIFLAILLIGELAAAILSVVYKDKIDAEIQKSLKDSLINYDNVPEIREAIDILQKTFKCCGSTGREDYTTDVPKSCEDFVVGCAEKFGLYLKHNMIIVACVAFGVCFIQLMIIIVAFCLANRIHQYAAVST